MQKVVISALTFIILSWGVNANAITMTFEGLYQNNDESTFLEGAYEEAGFTLTASNPTPYSFGTAGDLNARFGGSTAIATYNYGYMALENSSGDKFSLLSLDVAPVSLGANDPYGNRIVGELYQATIYGLRVDGSIVSQVITLPNATSANVLTLVNVIGFTELTRVEIHSYALPGIQIDNLVLNAVSSVPEPESISLFLFGIGLLIGARRIR
ncbi:MAG: PEP-CTERM sorting domain-containing protein [Methylophilus sp.]|uniref:PEP-CTERM sorting domain-containing protein n=1 Tax=Methylophilus sp. TaxID=29541 RepID=UPI003FA01221